MSQLQALQTQMNDGFQSLQAQLKVLQEHCNIVETERDVERLHQRLNLASHESGWQAVAYSIFQNLGNKITTEFVIRFAYKKAINLLVKFYELKLIESLQFHHTAAANHHTLHVTVKLNPSAFGVVMHLGASNNRHARLDFTDAMVCLIERGYLSTFGVNTASSRWKHRCYNPKRERLEHKYGKLYIVTNRRLYSRSAPNMEWKQKKKGGASDLEPRSFCNPGYGVPVSDSRNHNRTNPNRNDRTHRRRDNENDNRTHRDNEQRRHRSHRRNHNNDNDHDTDRAFGYRNPYRDIDDAFYEEQNRGYGHHNRSNQRPHSRRSRYNPY